ncbi:hypothetical protein JZO66_00535 [Enterococcus sp. DIV0242_7C1]|uniref:Uncharacterized protein n=1 Tax=Candidatus Enterococcus dunnyi TaxID=1834192 RepID=A0A200JGG9_9ENTE|nr:MULTISPECIES: hypothetical protein [unclassified Enterococcus]MBO0469010.1 hypothetical protein [Enterococcus sp. DIV0242_7C1]MCA5012596.1 hypothetical protein [Enterococcus sp. S23]MCA5015847.1 hypothetical protein [Enterococcus sp. S22(2020)]OUZ35697.1 hypothetical protein A5889_001173 [Enterococcus sp. 9D6_DIV0238]
MTSDYDHLTQEFLAGLVLEERTKLYNDLLALEEVHKLNQHSSYYTFRNLKRIFQRHSERRKRTFRYINSHNNELLIHQIHEQHFCKNKYCIQIYFNSKECNYLFIDQLLTALKAPSTSPLRNLREIAI